MDKNFNSVSLPDFSMKYSALYAFLYDLGKKEDEVDGRRKALDQFDFSLTQNEKNFLKKFSQYRHDLVTSDREVIAFMWALAIEERFGNECSRS